MTTARVRIRGSYACAGLVLALACQGDPPDCEALGAPLVIAWSRHAGAARAEAAEIEGRRAAEGEIRRHLDALVRGAAVDLDDGGLATRVLLADSRDRAELRYIEALEAVVIVADELHATATSAPGTVVALASIHARARGTVQEAALALMQAEAALATATHGAPRSQAYPGPGLAAADLECTRRARVLEACAGEPTRSDRRLRTPARSR